MDRSPGEKPIAHRLVMSGVALLAVVLTAALTVAACGTSGGGTGGPSSQGSASPVKGGTMVVAYQADPQYLDPALDWEGNGWSIEHCLYNTFLTYASGHGQRPAPSSCPTSPRRCRRSRTAASATAARPTPSTSAGHQVRAAGEPRGHGAGLQVQLRAHDGAADQAQSARPELLPEHRRGQGVQRPARPRRSPASRWSTRTPCRSTSRTPTPPS